ncbi:MAG: hypothetical protein GX247_05250 [Mollicutes bacterium]|nr:hypothetical protein [Mollicutes bacterium]
MNILERNELLKIVGGISISGTLINSIVRGINALLEVGRSLGSAIRRIVSKNICPI